MLQGRGVTTNVWVGRVQEGCSAGARGVSVLSASVPCEADGRTRGLRDKSDSTYVRVTQGCLRLSHSHDLRLRKCEFVSSFVGIRYLAIFSPLYFKCRRS